MSNIIQNVDLSHPLTDHPIWRDVRGVWLPCGNTAGGSTLYDLGPYGNHGTLTNMDPATDWVATERGIGLDFDGTDDTIPLNDKSLFNGLSKWSCVFDISPSQLSDHNSPGWGDLSATTRPTVRYVSSDSKWHWYASNASGNFLNIASSRNATIENQHIVCAYDNTISPLLYRDGRDDFGSGTYSAGTLTNYDNAFIAPWSATSVVGFYGIIRSAIVFARALSASEIAFLYEQSLTGYPDLIRQTSTRRYFFPKHYYYSQSVVGPRQATAEDTVGDNDGILSFSDTVTSWKSDVPDGSYVATVEDAVGSNDGTMTDFSDVDAAHVDHNINDTFPAIIPDLGSGGNDGELHGGLADSRSPDVPANSGSEYSLNLDGVDDYVDCGTDDSLNLLTLTVVGWVKPSSSGYIYTRHNGTTGQLGVYIDGTKLKVYIDTQYDSELGITNGSWNHAVVVIDGADYELFINGSSVKSGTFASSIVSRSGYSARIGCRKSGATGTASHLSGLIDDVRIYDTALSASEISDLYNGTEISKVPVGHWRFDAKRQISYLNSSKAIEFQNNGLNTITHSTVGFNATDAWSWCAWIKADILDGSSPAYSMLTGGSGYATYIAYVNNRYFKIRDQNNNWHDVFYPVLPNEWNYVVVTYDNGLFNVYFDGILRGNLNVSTRFDFSFINNPTYYLIGKITDPRIYNRALSAAEVKQLAIGTDVTSGLVARWPFDDAPRSIPNVAGGLSLEFDGTSDYVDVGSIGTLMQGLTKWTVCGWVKLTTLANLASPFFGDFGIGSQPAIRVNGSGLSAMAHDGTSSIISNANGPAVTVGEWMHLCVRRGNPSDLNTLYVNGIAYPQSSVTIGGALTNDSNNRIGGGQNGSAYPFPGLIDDVRIYDVALSAADITNLYNGIEPSTAPIAHWPFDDGPQADPSPGDGIATLVTSDKSHTIMSQSTASKRPTVYMDSDNKYWMDFDSDYLKVSKQLVSNKSSSILLVTDDVATTGTNVLFATSDEASDTEYFAVAVVNDKIVVYQYDGSTLMTLTGSTSLGGTRHVIGIFSDGTTTTCELDGAVETLSGTDTGNTWGDADDRDNITLGALINTSENDNATAKIARILLYDRMLYNREKDRATTYLKKLYGVS